MEGELEPRQENLPASPADPGRLRVSDEDRHRVAELLREAAGEGRLDLEELDQRLEAAYAARTYAELAPITSDLPASQTPAVPSAVSPAVPGPPTERHVAIMSGLDRSGEWTVPAHLKISTFMGGAELDLREATFAAREVVITINAFMGGARIIVGPHTNVVIEGIGFMGGYSGPSGLVSAELDDDSPTVRVNGLAVLGGVSIERKRL
ncbi:DUF1707 domain-containing protein [Nocardioides sp.]|uniref:DUF1707 SHOCT-like domain-containing protein n=1 Tax=Nocardioides sp. TaxID=35761 RepID=UPI0031FE7E76|nr:hypothetical protein [Nocardioides sp.]